MRARLLLKIVSLVVMLALTVLGARSCSSGPGANSPLDPTNVARNGVAGLCANQQATAAASGGASPTGLDVSQSGFGALSQALGGDLSCPTTTVSGGG